MSDEDLHEFKFLRQNKLWESIKKYQPSVLTQAIPALHITVNWENVQKNKFIKKKKKHSIFAPFFYFLKHPLLIIAGDHMHCGPTQYLWPCTDFMFLFLHCLSSFNCIWELYQWTNDKELLKNLQQN